MVQRPDWGSRHWTSLFASTLQTPLIAPTTILAYKSAATRYLTFCECYKFCALPLQEETLAWFVAYLADSGLAYPSICMYFSGLRFLQLSHGLPDPCLPIIAGLECVLRGIRRSPSISVRPRHLPITPVIHNASYKYALPHQSHMTVLCFGWQVV